ncbi:hypothetical protein P3T21_007814, partial [Paraburkholderia sp. GAS334]
MEFVRSYVEPIRSIPLPQAQILDTLVLRNGLPPKTTVSNTSSGCDGETDLNVLAADT